nr:phage major capsid protein [Kibdelosporangium sp. MJ126-NF4]CEL22155.1 Phage major capsid protein [Kibdelosporangium sp. MJ126-NF4]CTQ92936.1 hypothetical protein [Kibdelosporangium sp. MJ126-NF4]CTQ95571.1 Phage major capsid protein [Kibdelosporangium sp. MJ126-NF4]
MSPNPYLAAKRARYDEIRSTMQTMQDTAVREDRDLTELELRQITEYAEQARELAKDVEYYTELADREASIRALAAELGQADNAPTPYEPLGTGAPHTTTAAGSPFELAHRSVDAAFRAGLLPDYGAERITTLITQGPAQSRSLAARWAVTAGAEHYRTAFVKLLADPQRGHLLWTPDEGDAFRQAAETQTELRAMSGGTDTAGGFMVPVTLDPTIMLSSAGSVNPLRQVARIVQTTTDGWNGITSAGATAEWKTEGASVADASPTLQSPGIPVHFGDAFVPYSYELGMDAAAFLAELARVLSDAADQLQATAYMNGTGTGQPTGLVTSLPPASRIATAAADTIVPADVVKLQNALPPRFQPRAQWCANLATINTLGSFETSNGSLRFPEVSGGNLLRKPLHEASTLETAGSATGAGTDDVLLYGDFQHFVIVDRIGTSLELIPNLLDPNTGRPTAQRGAMLWFRTGSDVVVDNAFRLLTA